jgi:hypothetical protein
MTQPRRHAAIVFERASLVAFVATHDLEAAGAFYGSVLRLPLVDASGFARVYNAHGTQLRVTLVESLAEAPYTVLGWRVEDIAETAAQLRAVGSCSSDCSFLDTTADRHEPLRRDAVHL